VVELIRAKTLFLTHNLEEASSRTFSVGSVASEVGSINYETDHHTQCIRRRPLAERCQPLRRDG
jgi:hypothetical protein